MGKDATPEKEKVKLIVDATAWYALFVAGDQFHEEAQRIFQKQPVLVTNYIVFEEVVALIYHRFNKQKALEAAQGMITSCKDNFWYINDTDQKEILTQFKNTATYIDYVDASVVWLAQKFDLPIFTFDDHFRKLKLLCVP